jgi:glycyl-tRNA synthetase
LSISFQQVILRLQDFWAERGCLIWQPYSEKVGAGTLNPATALRVLGPEPWNVAYVEPSYRPPDGRYGENPNRMQLFYQFQVILKPDPGDPQEQYLESLYALGIEREKHDIRFVEDNWESPALGAWGLGWEVWLDGLEISQYTYFQQAGGYPLDPVSVELTYGLERIAMALQGVRSVWDIDWDGTYTYGDVLLQPEIENCRYDFELANVDRLTQMYDLFEAEAQSCLEAGLVIPAHDYVLRCSHTFNVLDSRGAVGVTERATYFRRMRDLSREVAEAYAEQRERMEYPFYDDFTPQVGGAAHQQAIGPASRSDFPNPSEPSQPAPFLLEIGTEELPAGDLEAALSQLRETVLALLKDERLDHGNITILGTPRRLVVSVDSLAPTQTSLEEVIKGPPAGRAFDSSGEPTKAAEGFARSKGVPVSDLEVREIDGGQYVVATVRQTGRSTSDVLKYALPSLIASLRFEKSMRWNSSNKPFSRPIRWLLALHDSHIIPFRYADVDAQNSTRGLRFVEPLIITVNTPDDYFAALKDQGIILDPEERRARIAEQAAELAASVGGKIPDDPALLSEVTNLVEQPTALLGHFEEEYLKLPDAVLIAVMKKHQRYFPVVDSDGHLMPYFVAVRNGGEEHLDSVRRGNEEVIRARFADADFFYREDVKQPLEDFLPRLDTLTFQEQLGSMLDKTQRLEKLVPQLAEMLGLNDREREIAQRAARLCKADLATQMVVEFTSLQGVMGREYALKSGEDQAVAEAIYEHYLPRFSGDALPETKAGLVVGLADRLDSLLGLVTMGLLPSGSSDPYQLRRDAIGVIQILTEHQLSFSLEKALDLAKGLLPSPPSNVRFERKIELPDHDIVNWLKQQPPDQKVIVYGDNPIEATVNFIADRFKIILLRKGFRYDIVEAVLVARSENPFQACQTVEALSRWVARDDWSRILDNYARCVRITRDFEERFNLNPAHFQQPTEEKLYAAYQEARAQVTPQSSVDEFLAAFVPLVDVIDAYFARESGVLVMDEDADLRENRLAQLQHIAALAEGIVDLSRLEGF